MAVLFLCDIEDAGPGSTVKSRAGLPERGKKEIRVFPEVGDRGPRIDISLVRQPPAAGLVQLPS